MFTLNDKITPIFATPSSCVKNQSLVCRLDPFHPFPVLRVHLEQKPLTMEQNRPHAWLKINCFSSAAEIAAPMLPILLSVTIACVTTPVSIHLARFDFGSLTCHRGMSFNRGSNQRWGFKVS